MDNFVTIDFMTSFQGMIILVLILTQVFKGLVDKWKKIPSEYLAYIFAVVLCLFASTIKGDWTTIPLIIQTIIMWIIINPAIIWLSATKGYEKTMGKSDGALVYNENKWSLQLDKTPEELEKKKNLMLKVTQE